MKKKWLMLTILVMTVLAMFTACNGGHKHTFSGKLTNDETYHWYECEGCDEKFGKAPHNYGDDIICDDCGYKKTSEGLAYVYDKGTDSYIVTDIGSCVDNEIVIPGTYDNKPVTSIGDSAFKYCGRLRSIEIPNGVTSIGDSAFYGCSSITGIELPDSLIHINDRAFYECISLTSIVIPDGVTSIGDQAFRGCTNLSSIDLSLGLTSIRESTFYDCMSLKSIVIPNRVTSIGDSAFQGCYHLASIDLSLGVTSIGWHAFYGCSSLQYNTYNNARYLGNKNDPYLVLVEVKNRIITECEINEKTKLISDYAFYNCQSLTNIEIPNSVTDIGVAAFGGCQSLTSVIIGNGVTSIGGSAFNGCRSLTSIEIPSGVTSIGGSAFDNCSSLTSIVIPNSVTSVGEGAFDDCFNLQYNTYNNAKYLGNKDDPYLVLVKAENEEITECEINEKTKFILDHAFYGCTNLTSIEIPSCVTYIGYSAFYGCESLTSVTIENGITNIDSSAFNGCNNLKYNIYNNAKYLGNKDNPYLVLVKANNKAITKCEINKKTELISDSAFEYCSSLQTIEIPSSVTSIENAAFSSCQSLTSIEIPNSVTSIGYRAFEDCYSLTSVYYHGTAEEWNGIEIDDNGNDDLLFATLYFYSASDPTLSADYNKYNYYWHYNDQGEIVAWDK